MKTISINAALGLLALGVWAGAAQANWDHAHYDRDRGYAQSRAWVQEIDRRIARQHARLQAGAREGDLTRREFRRLAHQHEDIHALRRHFLADGRLDAHEFHRLDRALDAAHLDIVAERHDPQARRATWAPHRHD